jgi:predicted nucleotidyltransferase
LCPELASLGGELGGHFLLYGSAARGDLRDDSDVDLLLDFPDDSA